VRQYGVAVSSSIYKLQVVDCSWWPPLALRVRRINTKYMNKCEVAVIGCRTLWSVTRERRALVLSLEQSPVRQAVQISNICS
jgi:hypothetical protein